MSKKKMEPDIITSSTDVAQGDKTLSFLELLDRYKVLKDEHRKCTSSKQILEDENRIREMTRKLDMRQRKLQLLELSYGKTIESKYELDNVTDNIAHRDKATQTQPHLKELHLLAEENDKLKQELNLLKEKEKENDIRLMKERQILCERSDKLLEEKRRFLVEVTKSREYFKEKQETLEEQRKDIQEMEKQLCLQKNGLEEKEKSGKLKASILEAKEDRLKELAIQQDEQQKKLKKLEAKMESVANDVKEKEHRLKQQSMQQDKQQIELKDMKDMFRNLGSDFEAKEESLKHKSLQLDKRQMELNEMEANVERRKKKVEAKEESLKQQAKLQEIQQANFQANFKRLREMEVKLQSLAKDVEGEYGRMNKQNNP